MRTNAAGKLTLAALMCALTAILAQIHIPLPPVPVNLGIRATVQPVLGEGTTLLLEKAAAGELQQSVSLAEAVDAPVEKGTSLGTLTVSGGDGVVAEIPLLAGEDVPRITYGQMLLRLLQTAFLAA